MISMTMSEENEFVRLAYVKRMIKAKNNAVIEKMAIHETNSMIKEEMARNSYCLNLFLNDKDSFVRAAVVSTGFGLSKLAKSDESLAVKQAIIKYGYPEKRYFKDPDLQVIAALAEYGFINDDDAYRYDDLIRMIVAEKTNHPEKFSKDTGPCVRRTVAKRGYNHKIFAYDTCTGVREAAKEAIIKSFMNTMENL